MKDILDFICESDSVTTESYFGKRAEFEKAERLVDQIRDLIVNKKASGSITNTKQNKALEEIFRNVFGFKRVHILWIDAVVPNAFTVMSSFVYKGSKESKSIVKDPSKGYYDKGHNDILFVAVYTGLLSETNLTNEEFMGVILHEIGHNFDYSVYNILGGIIQKLVFPITPEWKEKYFKHAAKDEEFKSKHNYTDEIYKEFLDLREKIRIHDQKYSGLLLAILSPFYIPVMVLSAILPFDSLSVLSGKKKENFADSFAAAYGYGSGCMAGLEKLMAYPKNLKNASKFTKVMVDISNCYNEVALGITEEHGTHQERVSLAIMKLERDLKSGDFPPEMKSDLEKELEKLKQIYKNLLTYNKDEWNYISVTYRKVVDFLFKGTNLYHRLFPKNQA